MNKIIFIPLLNIPEIIPGDNISQILINSLTKSEEELKNNDVLVITQKIISKSEHRIINLNTIKPNIKALKLGKKLNKNPQLIQVILDESKSIIKIDERRGIIITENKIGHISANSGIDHSNVDGDNHVTLLPENPDLTAKIIHGKLINTLNLKNIGIIISDTFGRPWRIGQTNISIGSYGINPINDYKNEKDVFGVNLNSTQICIVDELAGGAEILMKKTNKIPAVLIRGMKFNFSAKGSKLILRDKKDDLFR
tara:strand:- start:442 stop:1203 length:762 start_codon:yes stop_codon:yes gene_type:complete